MILTHKKMLLIDGDEGIRKSLSLFFGSRHCRLDTVENGAQALKAVSTEPYDVILCEELLPDMNGLIFFKIVNDRCCDAIKILISWYGNNTAFADIHGKGIDFLLTKPFSGDDVEAAVIKLVKARSIRNGSDCT
ncbi:response regulator [Desulfopila sp. IMCC35006]|uniref:response regulator n=1 Tax=Desulfopila sp. IMCC35006 TaxID=2569542 RepID=UPI0010AB6412|nr:response regulator [Desulfopila sp. IMCC35006]TKB27454.1 response regulator [Desulfopila sp. IMCC35006]